MDFSDLSTTTPVHSQCYVSARRRPVGFREHAVLHMRKRDLGVNVRCQWSCLLKIIFIISFVKVRFYCVFSLTVFILEGFVVSNKNQKFK